MKIHKVLKMHQVKLKELKQAVDAKDEPIQKRLKIKIVQNSNPLIIV